jgi:hypothetical protein
MLTSGGQENAKRSRVVVQVLPASKSTVIHAILHRLQIAAARVHQLPTVRQPDVVSALSVFATFCELNTRARSLSLSLSLSFSHT